MKIGFDERKDAANRKKHGLSLADSIRLDLNEAVILRDERRDYGESRFRAYGFIEGRMHMLAFTVRDDVLRPISFRKANSREVKRHGS